MAIPTFPLGSSYRALSRAADAVRVRSRKPTRAGRRLAPALSALACAALAVPAAASAASTLSTNWSGYLAVPSASVGSRFETVSGTWTEPAATCTTGRETYSAVWVGLGGAREGSDALEQVGTDADCARSGRAVYSSWYELVPAAPVDIRMAVRPGDQMAASVTVSGHVAVLRIRDLTTGARVSLVRAAANVDVSTAEWIVEAPSSCAAGGCRTLALTDFGTVTFTSATAVAHRHTGALLDAHWSTVAVELQQRSLGAAARGQAVAAPVRTIVTATPSAASLPLGAFTVTWGEQAEQREGPQPPTLPGFGAGET